MEIRIDFQLNNRFSIVEKLIFRFVLNGFTDSRDIVSALPIFSDAVLVSAVKTLVNSQILGVNLNTFKFRLSEPILALTQNCISNHYSIEIPFFLKDQLKEGLVISSIEDRRILKDVKDAILKILLPDVNLSLFINTLDFVLYEYGGESHNEQ